MSFLKFSLITALIVISHFTFADTWVMNNLGNGKIVITDRLCKGYKHVYQAYAYTDKGYLEGCWALMDGKVHIAWEKGQGRRVYDKNDFVQDFVEPKKSKSDSGQNSNSGAKGESL